MTSPNTAGGLTVGPYRLLSRIGEGGMGVVHLAAGPDGRRVALKALRPQVVGDDEGRRRLAREVASLRHVSSPYVAAVLDADPWGETPYIVTRYVPGHSLHETVERDGVLRADDLDHVARALLRAVADVHAADVLHRDLKPTNVVMEGRTPILIDFGLARLAEDPRLTQTGWLLGTPGYLAPEMLFGDPATPATDVHGWAATLVYAATGQPPYGRGHQMALLDRTRRGEVSLGAVPAYLRPLLAGCLALEPLDRPTVREVADELDRVEQGAAPTTAVPVAVPEMRSGRVPDPTMPWQLVPHEEPATEVLRPVREPVAEPVTEVLRPVQEPATQVLRPVPAPAPSTEPAAHPAVGRRLDGGGRLRRGAVLLGVGAAVAEAFRLAPYLTLAFLACCVFLLRGVSFSQETAWRRRTFRGTRWYDVPLSLVGFPWQLLRASLGSLLLVLVAGGWAATAVAGLVVLEVRPRDALLAGGLVMAAATWWGPGSQRLRHPVGRGVTALARHPVAGWLMVAATVLVVAVLWLVLSREGVTWTPGSPPPWDWLRDLLPVAL